MDQTTDVRERRSDIREARSPFLVIRPLTSVICRWYHERIAWSIRAIDQAATADQPHAAGCNEAQRHWVDAVLDFQHACRERFGVILVAYRHRTLCNNGTAFHF